MRWDPQQYERFSDERGRPFGELLARVFVEAPKRVVDLGCGPGSLTKQLVDRWPHAHVTGVDSSVDMVVAAQRLSESGRLDFIQADLPGWQPDQPVDAIVANALLHWIPGHVDWLPEMAAWLAPGGVLAFQVPDNFGEPSHTILRDLRLSARWRKQLGDGADRSAGVERPQRYLDALATAGLRPDVWQTTYLHVLTGDDPVLEWVKGTALRPVLSRLDDEADRDEFLQEYAAELRAAYPRTTPGTVFLFRRTFAVGHAV